MKDPRQIVAKAINEFKTNEGFLTVKAMADQLGVNASTLGKWSTGKKLPSEENLKSLKENGVDIPVEIIHTDHPTMFDNDASSERDIRGQNSFYSPKVITEQEDTTPELPVSSTPSKVPGSDPLNEKEAKKLLALVDIIRDPLHGDIQLTALERHLIDTPEFQRLRDINQLAPTYYVYPGALHNRFLHALGTLHVCAQMIATCNENAEKYRRLAPKQHPVPVSLTPYTILLARLCALLHDTAHVPFGHILEKEGGVFTEDEWKDKTRVDLLFGSTKKPKGFALHVSQFFKRENIPDESASGLIEDIRNVLTVDSSEARAISSLRYPFVHDLVGNTICADLIDYVQRDSYFAGLTERFGDRFLKYLAVVPVVTVTVGKSLEIHPRRVDSDYVTVTVKIEDGFQTYRLVFLQYRYNERREIVRKHDTVAEAVDLVRRRLAVAEKLYFHRTKVVVSSMLITAVFDAKLTAMDLWDLSDREVIKKLRDSNVPRVKVLGQKIWDRKLFKPIYRISYLPSDGSEASVKLWKAYEVYKDPKTRGSLIDRLERIIGLIFNSDQSAALGSVAIYCPGRDMNVKSFDMLVLSKPEDVIGRLEENDHLPTKKEIEAIKDMHYHLWKLEVIVDPEVVPMDEANENSRKLAGAIQREIGPRNEAQIFQGVEDHDLQKWGIRELVQADLKESELLNEVSMPVFEDLCEMANRNGYDELDKAARQDLIKRTLADMGK